MVFSNMVNLSDCRTSYNYTAQAGKFMFNGTCVFNAEKLVEANGTVFVPVENPEVEGDTKEVGSFNYSYYYDERVNYSFYVEDALAQEYFPAILTVLSEIKAQNNNSN